MPAAMTLLEWTLLALLHFAPIDQHPSFPGFDEDLDQRLLRYGSIARDITAAAEAPELVNDGLSDRDEAAALVAQAVGETGLALDADRGPCFRGKPGTEGWSRCDYGRSATVFQIWRGVRWEGKRLSYLELFEDRARAARIMLWAWRSSLATCRHLPFEDRLANLGGGSCKPGPGQRGRMRFWLRVRAWNPTEAQRADPS